MPLFEYQARKTPAELVSGTIQADSQAGAVERLSQMGLFPLSLKPASIREFRDRASLALSPSRLIEFTRETGELLAAGLSLVDALELQASREGSRKTAFISRVLADRIREGDRFSDALGEFPRVFLPLYRSVSRSGELSGNLEGALLRLSEFHEKHYELKTRILEALGYPLFLFFMGWAAVFVLTLYVIPRLTPMFEEMNMELPAITRFFIGASEMLRASWKTLFAVLLLAAILLVRIARLPGPRARIENLLLKIPVLGRFLECRHLSETFQSLASLVQNGIPPLQAMEIGGQSCGFGPYREALNAAARDVSRGMSPSESLRARGIFPPKVHAVLSVGEESGRLDYALGKLAAAYTQDFEKASRWLTRLAGPLFIMIIAVFVGLIIIAMLLPILNLNVNL
jgi:type IV pilus assembly protein PilC